MPVWQTERGYCASCDLPVVNNAAMQGPVLLQPAASPLAYRLDGPHLKQASVKLEKWWADDHWKYKQSTWDWDGIKC